MVLQAMDAAGKDGTIRHVMSGVNPQGVQVSSFKVPSSEDLDHDYLWRYARKLPERGNIGIFNRSYYEEVLVVRVHPQILAGQKIPAKLKDRGIWNRRFREINDWEHYLTDQGYRFVKLFLNLSKEEQRRRFLTRIDEADRNWKFSCRRRPGAVLLGRLPEGVQRRPQQDEHTMGALVRRPGRRQAVRPGGRGRHPGPHPHRDRSTLPDDPVRGGRAPSSRSRSSSRRRRLPERAPDPIEDELAKSAAKGKKPENGRSHDRAVRCIIRTNRNRAGRRLVRAVPGRGREPAQGRRRRPA